MSLTHPYEVPKSYAIVEHRSHFVGSSAQLFDPKLHVVEYVRGATRPLGETQQISDRIAFMQI